MPCLITNLDKYMPFVCVCVFFSIFVFLVVIFNCVFCCILLLPFVVNKAYHYRCSFAGRETRCYCNEAGCVSTGYMCKSTTFGVCYSRLTSDGASVRSTHGCAESLPQTEYGACSRLTSTSSGLAGEMSLLLCCHHDMCNYRSDVVSAVAPPGERL